MSEERDDLYAEKHGIVRELFVGTADDNYITARWCYSEGLDVDFNWLAVHVLEKYLKAVLLLNGQPANKYGHDIVKLYARVNGLAADLLPADLNKPAAVGRMHWHDESPNAYLERLYRYGYADNRYLEAGYTLLPDAIYKLDRMVFVIRRLCCFLDAFYLPQHVRRNLRHSKSSDLNFTMRDLLMRQPDYWESVAGGKLADAINGTRGEGLRRIVLNHNLPFAPTDYEHGKLRVRSSGHNSILWRYILEPLGGKASDKAKKLAADTGEWAVKNIKFSDDVSDQMKTALANYRSQSRRS